MGIGAQDVSAVADIITALGTMILAGIAFSQLRDIYLTQKKTEENDRKWRTLQVCDRYDNDLIIHRIKDDLRHYLKLRDTGHSFSNEAKVTYRYSVRGLFNYFDSVAIGLQQELYMDEIVKPHLRGIISDWIVAFENDPLFEREHFGAILGLIDKWNEQVHAPD